MIFFIEIALKAINFTIDIMYYGKLLTFFPKTWIDIIPKYYKYE